MFSLVGLDTHVSVSTQPAAKRLCSQSTLADILQQYHNTDSWSDIALHTRYRAQDSAESSHVF